MPISAPAPGVASYVTRSQFGTKAGGRAIGAPYGCIHMGEGRLPDGARMIEPVIIGDATLYCGDCMGVLPTLGKVDAVITDPPYGIGETPSKIASRGRAHGGVYTVTDYGHFDWDSKPASTGQIQACIAAGRHAVIWGGNYFGLPAVSKWLVWDKLNSGDFADCELAWTNLPGAVRVFRHMWNGMLRASEKGSPRVHPTQKPIALLAWCIEQSGNPETVLDPFMGSGTTGVACAQLGRKFIGIEIERKYFDIACRRIEQAYAQGKLELPEPAMKSQEAIIFD